MNIGFLVVSVLLILILIWAGFLAMQAAQTISTLGFEGDTNLKPAHAYAAGAASVAFIVAFGAIIGSFVLLFKKKTDSTWSLGLFGVIIIAGLITAGSLAIVGAQYCGKFLEITPDDSFVQSAKTDLVWASVLSFISIFFMIVGLVVYKYVGNKKADTKTD